MGPGPWLWPVPGQILRCWRHPWITSMWNNPSTVRWDVMKANLWQSMRPSYYNFICHQFFFGEARKQTCMHCTLCCIVTLIHCGVYVLQEKYCWRLIFGGDWYQICKMTPRNHPSCLTNRPYFPFVLRILLSPLQVWETLPCLLPVVIILAFFYCLWGGVMYWCH